MSKPDAWGVTKGDEILKQQKEETRPDQISMVEQIQKQKLAV